MITSYEYVLTRAPFVVRRRVRWSDCDPAGVVYTGKFTDYLLGAVHLFMSELGGGHYSQWLETLDVDTPGKGMELTFHHALWPEDDCDLLCTIGAVRESSYDINVEARAVAGRPSAGTLVFSGRFSPVCISRTVRKRVPIPAALLEALAAHRK